jgi:hypothetical protein
MFLMFSVYKEVGGLWMVYVVFVAYNVVEVQEMTSVDTDGIIATINAFIPIIIIFALLGAVMGALGKLRF